MASIPQDWAKALKNYYNVDAGDTMVMAKTQKDRRTRSVPSLVSHNNKPHSRSRCCLLGVNIDHTLHSKTSDSLEGAGVARAYVGSRSPRYEGKR